MPRTNVRGMQSMKARLLTRHDYALTPEGAPYYQLIEGALVMSPSPTSFHQDILSNLLFIVRTYLKSHPIGKVCVAPLDTYLSDINVYQPDLLFVRKRHRQRIEAHGVEGAPDLVVEILSPSTRKYDLGAKRTIYARCGVEEMWAIDPTKRSVALFRLQDNVTKPAATFRRGESFSSTLLPGLEISLRDVFAR